MHLSIPQFQYILKKILEFNNIDENEEFKSLDREEKPIILMASGMPMKTYIEFLNRKE